MTVQFKPVSVQGKTDREEPLFSPGALLQADDLTAISGYSKDLLRLMLSTLFGCGVVCGLVVRATERCAKLCVTVDCGVALDRCGTPVQVPKNQTLDIDLCGQAINFPLWVILCRTEKGCAPRAAVCADEDEDSTTVCTRSREGFEIRVVKELPECICRCEPGADREFRDTSGDNPAPADQNPCLCADASVDCHQEHYAGQCGCACSDCCDCDCVVLARVKNESNDPNVPDWVVDHRYRRFVRPVLMRDPQVAYERTQRQQRMLMLRQQQMKQADAAGQEAPEGKV